MRETPADAVFILGDLFEVWVGDDAADEPGFLSDCAGVLRQASRHADVFFMHGNRDFLVGQTFLKACGTAMLQDPTVLDFIGKRWLLTHGDTLCLTDTEYLQFRAQVRSAPWQETFLAKPLIEREAIGRALREQSEARKRADDSWADLDSTATTLWLEAARAAAMIHGHTHRPAEHTLPGGLSRTVLSDWDAAAAPPRLQALRLTSAGMQRVSLS
jgi:UDP-2,3-diacylglucosamine hydrolase